jgi:hypothetical protein
MSWHSVVDWRDTQCPYCGAPPYFGCTTKTSGRLTGQPHLGRVLRALRAQETKETS